MSRRQLGRCRTTESEGVHLRAGGHAAVEVPGELDAGNALAPKYFVLEIAHYSLSPLRRYRASGNMGRAREGSVKGPWQRRKVNFTLD